MRNTVKKQKGFTIIEVLIVLAIAGLILLIVFLAVPALQRNSRNTQRKNDVAAILSAVSEYSNNNSGNFPISGTINNFTGSVPKLGIYTAANVTWTKQSAAAQPADPADVNKVTVANFAKCNGNQASITGATSRSVVVLFDLESSSANQKIPQCQET